MNIAEIFADARVDELLINGAASAWVYRDGGRCELPRPFADQSSAIQWIQGLARQHGVRLDPLYPANGGVIAAASLRWHCVLPPVAEQGPVISIRRHRFAEVLLRDFVFSCGHQILMDALAHHKSILICGGTGSGKTTLLATLMQEFMTVERLMILEHLPELPIASSQWVRLVERAANVEGVGAVGIDRLFEEALRLRPDRFVIGEIRGREAPIYLRSIMSGHRGSLATMHAATARQARERLMALCQQYADLLPVENILGVFIKDRRVEAVEAI